MPKIRRLIRRWFASILGMPGHVDLWWTPQLPVVYVNNPKCGCSTVKNTLKQAQASRFRKDGISVFRQLADPHSSDDCLKRKGLRLGDGDRRLVISCARNPYTRALSAYLDKACDAQAAYFPELRGSRPDTFEAFLELLSRTRATALDPHFCPQRINLWLPQVAYDAIFYLENAGALQRSLCFTLGDFELATFAPHSRSAQQKLRAHYTPRAIELVQQIYAADFDWLGYSRDIARATDAPGAYWTPRGVVPFAEEARLMPASGMASLKSVIRYQTLIEARLI